MDRIILGITDDDALIVSLLESFFKNETDIEVLFTANSGHELLNKLAAEPNEPEILLLDLKMEGMDGIAVTEHLKVNHPNIKIIVVSSHYQKSFMGFMVKTGVAAFLPKGISPLELVAVIRAVHKQGYYFKEEQLETLREQIAVKTPKPVLNDDAGLSEREIDVLRLICQQKTAKEIGELLFIAQRTAEGHKNNLFVKTGAKNIAGLVIYAIQQGIIKAEELPLI
ncbi:response regulator transcription factor [Flavobacterium litorale]|uniref:Response regulator transcription factor n=1 Tax=Flavobacterium litorale TaxID=2856519 RepID=A0ABX8V8M1_9FLAO|nr:response regulator transcription factor [Flavobacterium litorale]QYJ68483.1 response regulator transcription factor [Flavobacterium litorale]